MRPPVILGAGAVIVVLAAAILLRARSQEDHAAIAPAASSLAESTADPASTVWHYAIDPKSPTQVDMPGLTEHIKGDTSAAAGTLDVTPKNLAMSRGLVRVDLSTFSTHTFGTDQDETQTTHARTWLEAVVDGKLREDMRWADFAIRTIDGLSATDLTEVTPMRERGDDVRTVTMTVHGDLLIHGHKVDKDEVVDAAFRYPAGSAADAKPARIEIKAKEPMRVVLKEHDVRPRDPQGAITAWTTRLVSKVAETADITFTLGATPSS
jgi:hypothetical protein